MTHPPGPPIQPWNQGPGQPPPGAWGSGGPPAFGFPVAGPVPTTGAGNRSPDPGSRTASLVAKFIAIPLFLVVVALQQASIYLIAPTAATQAPVVAPGPDDQGLLVARLMLKISGAWPALAQGGEPLNSLDALWSDASATPTGDAQDWAAAREARINELRAAIVAAEMDRRAALVTAEVKPPDDAITRLDTLEARLTADEAELARRAAGRAGEEQPSEDEALALEATPLLRHDSELLRRHFQSIGTDSQQAIGPDDGEWKTLTERHGWFADLARVVGRPDTDPERVALFKGGSALLWMILAACALIGVLAVGALSASIWMIVMLSTRRLRFWFVPPLPGGSVYIEVVAAFIVAFLGTQLLGAALAAVPALKDHQTEVAMGIQWLVLLVVFWPLFRGVSVGQWRRDLGLIAPCGVLREMGAGAVGYLAGLPLLVVAGVLGVVLKQLQDNLLHDVIPPTEGGNPVMEMVSQGGIWQVVMLVALATIWAPIVEETVFRGCLFRHLRSRVGFLIAAPMSAMAFGLMHQYEIVLLGPVLALGVIFAFVREWRGSLIGAITMHALHNGTVLLFVIAIVKLSA